MYRIKLFSGLLLIAGLNVQGQVYAQSDQYELFTLFTTQQERQIIDRNRYKDDEKKDVVQSAVEEPSVKQAAPEPEPLTITVILSGVTIAPSGENVAWLNGKAYENGGILEDGSKVYISRKSKTLVQIQTPDGKYHALTTGETMDISYLKPVTG